MSNIIYYVRFKSAELFSVSNRNYFSYNNITYKISSSKLKTLLKELINVSNPLTAVYYIISKLKERGFIKLTK